MNYKLPIEEWIYNKYHIWRYDIPSKEVLEIAYHWGINRPSEIPGFVPKRYKWRKYRVCELYIFDNKSIEAIADIHSVSRTRVRTILWSIYWQYTNRFKKHKISILED